MTTQGLKAAALPVWDETDLPALLTLEQIAPLRYVSCFGDSNLNGRAYGGQVLGQAMMAACMSVDPLRRPTLLQFLFLQGTDPARPIDFEVTPLQDGKRFSSRHIRGLQDGKPVLDANASFSTTLDSPEHAAASTAGNSDPERLPPQLGVPERWQAGLLKLGGYSINGKPSLDFRIPDLEAQLDPVTAEPRLDFWLKTRSSLPPGMAMQAAAFAYLSDWWLNFSSLCSHMRELSGDRRLYISSLNHNIWFHRSCLADEWLFFRSRSASASDGRGLSVALVHDRAGKLVATTSQECLMAFA